MKERPIETLVSGRDVEELSVHSFHWMSECFLFIGIC